MKPLKTHPIPTPTQLLIEVAIFNGLLAFLMFGVGVIVRSHSTLVHSLIIGFSLILGCVIARIWWGLKP